MLSNHSTFANYQEHTNAVNRILIDMKKQLDQYRESPTANAQAVAIRERNLVTLIKYVEASAEIIQGMANARDAAYRAGIERGRELAEIEEQHTLSPNWPRRYHHDKEVNRAYGAYHQMMKWADHL